MRTELLLSKLRQQELIRSDEKRPALREETGGGFKDFFCSWRAECEEQRKYIVISTRNRLSTCGWPWIMSIALASPVSSLRQFNGRRSNSRDPFDRSYLRDLLTGWSQAVAAPLSGKDWPSQIACTPLCLEVQGRGRTHQNDRINELMSRFGCWTIHYNYYYFYMIINTLDCKSCENQHNIFFLRTISMTLCQPAFSSQPPWSNATILWARVASGVWTLV